ncbi:EamA family transporter [Microlunatus soli]|uniref:Drug/metabolite transporter, DME family n=1 Tax=Microlunatus soli TaxID=630515 RepID=A0A1H1QUF3_9ACTN|nr:EamA family transporter [Microlunatus soli]SDS26499.1 drug/metabolite transporter, DME family [Microlunatus soli]
MSDLDHPSCAARATSGATTNLNLSAMIIAGIAWGSGGLFGSLLAAHAHVSAVAVAACRLLGGGLIVLAGLAIRRPRRETNGSRRLICAVGGLAALFQTGYFVAVILINVSLATLITIAAAPVLVGLVEIVTGRRRFSLRLAVILTLTIAGLGLLIGSPIAGVAPAALALGTIAALLSSASFATMTLIVARARSSIAPARLTGLGFTFGGLLLVPVVAVTGGIDSIMINPSSIAAAVALALIPTALAYSLYFRALATIPATSASVLAVIEPLTAAVLGRVVLGERLALPALAGGAFLLAAIVGAAQDAVATRRAAEHRQSTTGSVDGR